MASSDVYGPARVVRLLYDILVYDVSGVVERSEMHTQ